MNNVFTFIDASILDETVTFSSDPAVTNSSNFAVIFSGYSSDAYSQDDIFLTREPLIHDYLHIEAFGLATGLAVSVIGLTYVSSARAEAKCRPPLKGEVLASHKEKSWRFSNLENPSI